MPDTHRFTVGDFRCWMIQNVRRVVTARDFAPRFPDVPPDEFVQAVQDMGYDADAIAFSMNVLLVETDAGLLLVDTGQGEDGQLLDGLAALGFAPGDVDTILLTHGHPDHIGGLVDAGGGLVFPNARGVMWRSEYDFWLEAARASGDPNHYAARSLRAIRDRVQLIEAETELVPGIRALHAPGHTPGHLVLALDSRGERLLHLVDIAHVPVQLARPDWAIRFDHQPAAASATRRQWVEQAARENRRAAFYHFGFPGLGQIVTRGGAFVWQPEAEPQP